MVCTSAISSGSSCIFIASRTVYGLSRDGHAPKLFQQCNRFGTPHYAVGLTSLLLPLTYMSVSNNSSTVFFWFVNITTVSGLIGWVVIEVTYLRFYAGLAAQGYSRDRKLIRTYETLSANISFRASLSWSLAAIYILGDTIHGSHGGTVFWYVFAVNLQRIGTLNHL